MSVRRILWLAFFICPLVLHAEGITYKVDFQGIDDPDVLKTVKGISQLRHLKSRPPASINALRYRASADIPDFLKALHAHGYYEARISIEIEEYEEEARVILLFEPGPVYKIKDYLIRLYDGIEENCPLAHKIKLKKMGIVLGQAALAKTILQAELNLLRLLAGHGYPLAAIDRREILVDGETKTVHVNLEVQTGPLSHFGAAKTSGNTKVKPEFIRQKIAWQQGSLYDSHLVEQTQKSLMDSGLFSSILITHENALTETGQLPLRIDVAETKHKNVNAGVSYQTFYGPGITFGWENRNLGGLGRRFKLQGDITKRSHSGIALLALPDFRRPGQDVAIQAAAAHEKIVPYHRQSYSFTTRFERKFGKRYRVSLGGQVEHIHLTNSAANGKFTLLEFPLYFRWSSANNFLNPTRGATTEYIATPTANLVPLNKIYLTQEVKQTVYLPFGKEDQFVLAQKFTFGSILAPALSNIPLSKRFLGGSEEELRGYRYRTVSPLRGDKPLGGRSAFYYTLETRFRVTQRLGLVPFFDLGVVNLTPIPLVKGKWFKSVGLGYRYFSVLGPLRIDVAFPLNRRKGIDPFFRVLLSIGQTF